MTKNKVHYDVENVHVAALTLSEDNSYTYAVPERYKGVIGLDLSAEGDTIKIRADGIDYYVTNSNNGYSGDINCVQVGEDFKEKFLGEVLLPTSKVLIETTSAEPAPFALLFNFKGDAHKRQHVLYNCVAGRPNIQGENKENIKEPDTETLTITASPLPSGEIKASTTSETPQEVTANWYKEVFLPDENNSLG
jgi:phi13 family phage major tail protein